VYAALADLLGERGSGCVAPGAGESGRRGCRCGPVGRICQRGLVFSGPRPRGRDQTRRCRALGPAGRRGM